MSHANTSGQAWEQIDLFSGIAMPIREQVKPRRARACLRKVASKVVQLALDLRARAEDAAEEWVERWTSRPIIHEIVPAARTTMPETRAVASIFDLGCQVADQQVLGEFMLPQAESEDEEEKGAAFQDQAHKVVIREAGVIRCQRIHHTETDDWKVREAARRARQRPPKPPKKAKTMSAKLLELVGAGHAA